MLWYEGTIADAVSLSRKNGSIFVVYVEGPDDQSKRLTSIINEDKVSKQLASNNFVAIKVEANSVPHQQFAEIYKGAKVPSVYFIGQTGAPLDIIEDISETAEFLQTLENVLKKTGIAISTPAAEAQQSSNLITQERKDVVCENDVCTLKPSEPVAGSSSDAEKIENTETTLTTDEKVEKAKEIIEKKRLAKQKEEEEKDRQKELERRKMGQDVQKMKKLQQDQELKLLIEAREKDKKEQQVAKQKILDQIKQDRVDRAAKFSTSPPVTQPSQSISPPVIQRVLTGMTRIQFKLPDGSAHTHEFKSETTLQDIKIYIKENLNLSYNFMLATTFPKREFTEEHDSSTLAELELVPSAVLLILPVSHGTVSTNNSTFSSLLWSLLAPLLSILNYLKSMVFGAPKPPDQQSSTSESNKRAADTAGEPSRRFPKKRASETTVIRRQGNVHRLSDKNDSDDDTNTWNGNSTQQM